ncbi:hypothetical protein LTR37_016623 [Vermiconidia calcicola]|uniref:Uncharacterized protein n=1 Tax=Vermiconidia calcicola TaxID=1690605 RepID=A0ACC3MM86_9PEZI|nr:hypothetical protein LTR37_016623 [Vermiconidia calcicola]
MSDYTKDEIRSEGAEVKVVEGGSYSDTLAVVQEDAATTGALLVQDLSWDVYEEVPGWVAEGYSTMLQEPDRQIADAVDGRPTLAITSVGGGLWAQAVVEHYKASSPAPQIITVEADTAAGFEESLHCGSNTVVATGDTIMAGLNSRSTMPTAWLILPDGADVAVVVTDREAHDSGQELQRRGVDAGPCGAAALAALRKLLCGEGGSLLRSMERMVAVLFSTEGDWDYGVPE